VVGQTVYSTFRKLRHELTNAQNEAEELRTFSPQDLHVCW
jgi:hypothetical protein